MATYTLFGQPVSPATLAVDTNGYTMGVQFKVTKGCNAVAIWFYSPPGAHSLPEAISIYAVNGNQSGTLIHQETANWSGTTASGWVRAIFTSRSALAVNTWYKACVFNSDTNSWYSSAHNYWSSGPGVNGITGGILYAPNASAGDGGQDTFVAGLTQSYPLSSYLASNYWVDIEVTDNVPLLLLGIV